MNCSVFMVFLCLIGVFLFEKFVGEIITPMHTSALGMDRFSRLKVRYALKIMPYLLERRKSKNL